MDGSDYRREILIKLMNEHGTTAEDLASAIGVHPVTVAKYRSGDIKLQKKKRIQAISDYYNVSPTIFDPPRIGTEKPGPRINRDIPIQDKIEVIMQHHDNFLGKLFISCVNYFYNSMYPEENATARPSPENLKLPDTRQLDELKQELRDIKNVIMQLQEGQQRPPGPDNTRPFPKATTRKKAHRP